MVGSIVCFNITIFLSIQLIPNMKSYGLFELIPFALFLQNWSDFRSLQSSMRSSCVFWL